MCVWGGGLAGWAGGPLRTRDNKGGLRAATAFLLREREFWSFALPRPRSIRQEENSLSPLYLRNSSQRPSSSVHTLKIVGAVERTLNQFRRRFSDPLHVCSIGILANSDRFVSVI